MEDLKEAVSRRVGTEVAVEEKAYNEVCFRPYKFADDYSEK